MTLKTLAKRLKGGPGSGNFGHGGRPGKRGGSSLGKGGGAISAPPAEISESRDLMEIPGRLMDVTQGASKALAQQRSGKQLFDEGLFNDLTPVYLEKNGKIANTLGSTHDFVMRFQMDDGKYSKWEIAPRKGFFLTDKKN